MNSDKPIIWGAAAAVVAAAIAMYLYAHREHTAPTPQASAPEIQSAAPLARAPAASAPLMIEHPAPAAGAPGDQAAPTLAQSDPPFRQAMTALPGGPSLEKLLVPENIIRHIVVTVDNLSRKKVAVNQRPLKPTGGQFMTLSSADKVTINPENYARYQPFIEVVKAADPHTVVQLYYHFYPLFQNAFDDLGYKDAYFNDHLIALIDHLLATPDVAAPIVLVQPNVMYLYADPALEALSPGQKTLIRMGPANEALLKARLRELKAQLLAQQRAHP
jgi:hypothetical protein